MSMWSTSDWIIAGIELIAILWWGILMLYPLYHDYTRKEHDND